MIPISRASAIAATCTRRMWPCVTSSLASIAVASVSTVDRYSRLSATTCPFASSTRPNDERMREVEDQQQRRNQRERARSAPAAAPPRAGARHTRRPRTRARATGSARARPRAVIAASQRDRRGDQPAVDDEVAGGEEQQRDDQAAGRRRRRAERAGRRPAARKNSCARRSRPTASGCEIEECLDAASASLPRDQHAVSRERDRACLRPEQEHGREHEHLRRRELCLDRRNFQREASAEQCQRGENQKLPRDTVVHQRGTQYAPSGRRARQRPDVGASAARAAYRGLALTPLSRPPPTAASPQTRWLASVCSESPQTRCWPDGDWMLIAPHQVVVRGPVGNLSPDQMVCRSTAPSDCSARADSARPFRRIRLHEQDAQVEQPEQPEPGVARKRARSACRYRGRSRRSTCQARPHCRQQASATRPVAATFCDCGKFTLPAPDATSPPFGMNVAPI